MEVNGCHQLFSDQRFFYFIFFISYSVFGRKKEEKLLQVYNNLRHLFRVSHCFKRHKRRQKKKRKKNACVFFTPLLLQLNHSLFICQKATALLVFLIARRSAYYLDAVSTFSFRTFSVSKWLNSACRVRLLFKEPQHRGTVLFLSGLGWPGWFFGKARSFPPS